MIETNCPFYGRHFVEMGDPFILLASSGNECGLVRSSFSPCQLEVEGWLVNWRVCPRVKDIMVTLPKLGPLELPGDEIS